MLAVWKKEFLSYFRTMTGFVLIAFLVIFTGIYFMVYNMYQGYPYFSYTLSAVMTILLVWIPVLTMRSFADERKGKTDQILFTSPASIGSIVCGKYLAMVCVYLIPMVFYLFFPLIIKASGTAYILIDYVSIFQFALLGCVCIAIGMFFSSLTESSIIAAVSTFAGIFLIYVWESLINYLPQSAAGNFVTMLILCFALTGGIQYMTKNKFLSCLSGIITVVINVILVIVDSTLYENFFVDLLGKFDLTAAFENAAFNNLFDTPGTILQLTVIGVFLFFTVQSIEKRRWS